MRVFVLDTPRRCGGSIDREVQLCGDERPQGRRCGLAKVEVLIGSVDGERERGFAFRAWLMIDTP